MIEISFRNGNWEAYVNGGFFGYNSELSGLFAELENHAQDIEVELIEKEDQE